MAYSVQTITPARHLAWIRSRPSVSFLQTPAWGTVKRDWGAESVGWFRDGELAGAALLLTRPLPALRRVLAYVPEGPDVPWDQVDDAAAELLSPLVAHARSKGAFALTVGPPVWQRRWTAATVKAALAAGAPGGSAPAPGPAQALKLDSVPPDRSNPVAAALVDSLRRAGWREPEAAAGFGAGQPGHVFQVPLAGATEESVLAGFNQLWRRNIRKADKAGVAVERGGARDLAEFHRVYVQTAERDRFTPRPAAYFERMWAALAAEEADRIALYLARHEGQTVAAAIMTRVGDHAWYSYGASTTAKRDVRGSNAIQWRMIRDALAAGAAVYDLRGITDTLDPADPHFGLIQFKLGTGGRAQRYPGEWTYPIRPLTFKAFQMAMARR